MVEGLLDQHLAIGSATTHQLFKLFVHELSQKVVAQHLSESLSLCLSDMPIEGIAKIRHVGGWAIRKEVEKICPHQHDICPSPNQKDGERGCMLYAAGGTHHRPVLMATREHHVSWNT